MNTAEQKAHARVGDRVTKLEEEAGEALEAVAESIKRLEEVTTSALLLSEKFSREKDALLESTCQERWDVTAKTHKRLWETIDRDTQILRRGFFGRLKWLLFGL